MLFSSFDPSPEGAASLIQKPEFTDGVNIHLPVIITGILFYTNETHARQYDEDMTVIFIYFFTQ